MVFNLSSIAAGIGGSFFKPVNSDNSNGETVGGKTATVDDLVEVPTQNYGEKLDIGRNPAVDSLTDTIYNELRAGRDARLMTHSQGAPEMSRALRDVKNRLMLEDRLTPREAQILMSKIKVETFQSAAAG